MLVRFAQLADNVDDFFKNPMSMFSDHLPLTNQNSIVMSWNTLQQCRAFLDEKEEITGYNNGFAKVETIEEYRARRGYLLACLTREFQDCLLSNPQQLPIRVICLQEMQTDDDEIEKHLNKGFKVAKLENIKGSISQDYLNKHCQLMMLHSSDVEPVKKWDLSSLDLCKPERYQAVTFRDRKTSDEFVVVNVHQDYASVEFGSKPGLRNLKLLQQHFLGKPCIITGDFNTNNLPNINEIGSRKVSGINTNLVLNFDEGKKEVTLGACDHIFLNRKYYTELLPKLRDISGCSALHLDSMFFTHKPERLEKQLHPKPSQPPIG